MYFVCFLAQPSLSMNVQQMFAIRKSETVINMLEEVQIMPKEVYNIKGEIVSDTDDEIRWWHFTPNTWLLIVGLLLFNIGCFTCPGIIDSIFRSLDIRLWPWWYCLFLGVVVLFSIKWFLIYFRWEDYDGTEADAAIRFLRLSIAITVMLAFGILIHATRWMFYFVEPCIRWLGYGEFSWMVVLPFMFLLGIIVAFVYLFAEWIVIFWKR